MRKYKKFNNKESIGGSETTNFYEFIRDKIYVDKSLLIKEIIQ